MKPLLLTPLKRHKLKKTRALLKQCLCHLNVQNKLAAAVI